MKSSSAIDISVSEQRQNRCGACLKLAVDYKDVVSWRWKDKLAGVDERPDKHQIFSLRFLNQLCHD